MEIAHLDGRNLRPLIGVAFEGRIGRRIEGEKGANLVAGVICLSVRPLGG